MTKRLKILIALGIVSVAAAAFVLSAIVRRARPDFPPPYVYSGPSNPEEKGPRVVLWFDTPYYPVKNAIRIDVRGGLPHTRADETPIRDLSSYVNSEISRTGSEWLVVTASSEEKIGDVLKSTLR